ncbi:thiolase family protein [Nocardioides sp. L-11A]|uniref:thiolase family protein n=1 Tax=Nocardioides sp. L-11A TaxID=3043848 RepID=UPI00249A9010|nr:thiolase family protein [Nocardioides sp. L-11A]
MAELEDIVVLGGARTPIGSFGGTLADVPAHELGATAARGALARSGVAAEDIEEVVVGCIGQVGGDGLIARRVSVAAGLPYGVPSYSVNRQCGSGLQAIWSAAMQLQVTGSSFALAGGNESMSRMPFYDFTPRGRKGLGDRRLVDGTLAMLTDPFLDVPMGVTAENVAETYGVSRRDQDEFAVLSQAKAATPAATAAFAEEIVPVETGGRRSTTVTTDEHPRPETTLEMLAGLRPAFREGGSVTAGNSSGINDGGAAVVLARASAAEQAGLTGLARLEAVATAGNEPGLMGYAPVFALKRLFAQTGLGPGDIDVFEVNEAFAAQALAVIRDAGLDPEKVNPYGGAIALGHPVGATGATLSVRVVHDLARRDLELGVVTMCIGGGQALAALFRRI